MNDDVLNDFCRFRIERKKILTAMAIICPNSVFSSFPSNLAENPNDVGASEEPTAIATGMG